MTKKKVKQKEVKFHFLDNNRDEGEKKSVKREKIFFFFSSLISKIYGNWTLGFRRSKMQSRSTH